MGLFDSGSISSSIGAAQGAIGAVGGLVNAGGNIASALSAGRAVDIMPFVEGIGDLASAVASFNDGESDDWRVRLSLPTWPSFRSSPVLAPLKDAGGLIFPYTPEIYISSGAKYTAIPTVHTNYSFQAYQNSDPGEIKITAPMFCEDATQALYWIAMIHYLRSLTKMFAGSDAKAGNPPPLVMLNGYGNYVFKNVPVVVKNFSTNLGKDCDYISCDVVGSAAGAVEGVADSIGGLADTLGGAIPRLGGITSAVSSIAGGVGQIAGIAGTFGLGGSVSGGVTRVPTKSSFSITLQPVYSRQSARKFSLDRFVQGGYLNSSFGYV